jgi:hypothetical protein
VIRAVKIFGDYFNKFDTEDIEHALRGVNHEDEAIRIALSAFNIGDYFANLTLDEFMKGVF